MTVSVCMALYNGEKYLPEQLRSLWEQTRKPDEVILCDDGSSDRTIEIVRAFIEENHLENSWKLYQNERNLGYPGNFYHAMELCIGDAVFLADQDDVWHPDKIAKMCNILRDHPNMRVLVCKFGLIDEKGKDIHSIMAPAHSGKTAALRKVDAAGVFYKCEWPGMVIAYRRDWFEKECRTDGCGDIPHDFLLCARAAEEDGFFQLDEELAWHRRHANNTGDEEHHLFRLLNRARKLREIEDYLRILDSFDKGNVLKTEDGRQALARKLETMKGRYQALQSGKIGEVLKEAWKHRGQVRVATVVCDVLIVK